MTKPIPANGLSGLIQWSGEEYYLRVYNKDQTFSDYQIRHCDLAVTIHDPDAYLYPKSENSRSLWDGVIDHSPETLGLTNE